MDKETIRRNEATLKAIAGMKEDDEFWRFTERQESYARDIEYKDLSEESRRLLVRMFAEGVRGLGGLSRS